MLQKCRIRLNTVASAWRSEASYIYTEDPQNKIYWPRRPGIRDLFTHVYHC